MTQVERKISLNDDLSDTKLRGQGRMYIPHGKGEENTYRPHTQHIDVEYSDCGPDWSSQIRWLPSPSTGQRPKETTFYPPLQRLRHFPDLSNTTSSSEYTFYPPHGISSAYGKGKVTRFNSVHLASRRTYNEISDITQFGKKGYVYDSRDGFPAASPGDKPYRIPEYSPHFHRVGSTRPVVNFGGFKAEVADTFIPLQPLPSTPVKAFSVVEAERKKREEITEVASLDKWRPASPLQVPTTEYR